MAIEFHFRKGVFAIEDWYGPFEGWTADQHWNGWACPYFERDVALRMAAAWNEVTFEKDVFKAHYDEEHDQFCFYSESGENWECFGSQVIDVEGRPIIVYAIGTCDWIWEETLSR
jgi:hypothetical protein